MNECPQNLEALGDCYEAAGEYIFQHRHLTLVHGEVTGTGGEAEGIKYGHAWVEDGDWVIDTSNGGFHTIPKALYYAVGSVGTNTHHYTYQEFAAKAVETGVWGPWDLETESGY